MGTSSGKYAQICDGVIFVGVQDRVSEFFDNLMPLPDGTSYNSYLVRGTEKVALIDGVEPRFTDELLANLESAGVDHIDYIISNHAEQDHSGSFTSLLERFPDAVIVCNEKCKGFLRREHPSIAEQKYKVIVDAEELSLGAKTLRFIFAPWVHWPETMFTFIVEDRVLCTCDLFGAHLASDKLWVQSRQQVELPAKRYYAEIMMPFSRLVGKYTKNILEDIRPRVLAPSHGPIYSDPSIILQLHQLWTSAKVESSVVIAYVTMHQSTQSMALQLEKLLKARNIPVRLFNIMRADVGDISMSLINNAVFVLASPAYLGGLHPAAAHVLFLLNGFKPNVPFAGFMSSHGWEKECGFDQFKDMFNKVKPEFFNPVFVEGFPDESAVRQIDGLASVIDEKLAEINGRQG